MILSKLGLAVFAMGIALMFAGCSSDGNGGDGSGEISVFTATIDGTDWEATGLVLASRGTTTGLVVIGGQGACGLEVCGVAFTMLNPSEGTLTLSSGTGDTASAQLTLETSGRNYSTVREGSHGTITIQSLSDDRIRADFAFTAYNPALNDSAVVTEGFLDLPLTTIAG
jgi:hypothetical protein